MDRILVHKASCCTMTLLVTISSFCCIFIPSLTSACSPPTGDVPPISMHDRIHNFSKVLVYGRVVAHHEDTVYNYGTPNLFTAEMEVYCTYKGGPLPQYVNITGAGHIPGMCHHTRLSLGKDYVVLLTRREGNLEPREIDIEISGPTDANFDPITDVCGLSLEYPLEVEEAARKRECPVSMDCSLAKSVEDPNDAAPVEEKQTGTGNILTQPHPNTATGLYWYKITVVGSLLVTLLTLPIMEIL